MKKVLSILLVLLVLVGCSEKESVTVIKDKNEGENFSLANYKSFKIETNFTIEAYYDEEQNIVQYSVLENKTEDEINLDLNNKKVEEAVDLVLKKTPEDIEIKITSEDEEINNLIKDYTNKEDIVHNIYLNNEIINVTKKSIFDFENVNDYNALIFESVNWVNKKNIFKTSYFNNVPEVGSIDVIVFSPDYTGFYVRYFREGSVPVQTSFIWDEEGNIVFDFVAFTPIYNGQTIDYYENYFCKDGIHANFSYEQDKLTFFADNERGEYLEFKNNNNFFAPYNIKEYLSSIGLTVESAWTEGEKYASVWYETSYKNYKDDYNGVKTWAKVCYAN